MSSNDPKKNGHEPFARQPHLQEALDMIRNELLIPAKPHKDPEAASSRLGQREVDPDRAPPKPAQ